MSIRLEDVPAEIIGMYSGYPAIIMGSSADAPSYSGSCTLELRASFLINVQHYYIGMSIPYTSRCAVVKGEIVMNFKLNYAKKIIL